MKRKEQPERDFSILKEVTEHIMLIKKQAIILFLLLHLYLLRFAVSITFLYEIIIMLLGCLQKCALFQFKTKYLTMPNI